MSELIELDGSFMEGGGQILRTAVALSAVTDKPVKIFNIRKNRPVPGLRPQHLEGIKAISELCNGKLEKAEIGSEEISFYPEKIQNKELNITIGTAGSVGLLFQSLKVPASQAEGEVRINVEGGATFGKFAPPLIYTKHVLLPVLKQVGYEADIEIKRHGFYPVGGARVMVKVKPWKNKKPIILEKGEEVKRIYGISVASKHLEKAKVAYRQARAAEDVLKNIDIEIKTEYVDADCPGSGIVLWAKSPEGMGSSSLGERGKSSESVGKEAAEDLLKTLASEATVDGHISDQLLVYMALAKGKSTIIAPRLTNHTKTNIWTIKRFLPVKFDVKEQGKNLKIECSGS